MTRGRAWLAMFFVGLLAGATPIVFAPSASAAGSWGAGQIPYLDGEVCSTSTTTSPIAAWDFGPLAPYFLIAPVTSADGVDSAALPVPTAGAVSSSAVSIGQDGFGSTAEIASYAYLISHYGQDGTQHVAEVAAAVMAAAGSSQVPDCEGAGDESAILQTSTQLAGPYSVVVATPHVAAMGTSATVSARVLSAVGLPVPGAAVTFRAPGSDISPQLALTNADGVATTSVSVHSGVSGTSVPVQASASVAVGLTQLTAAPSSSGSTVAAVAATTPAVFTGSADLTIDQTASPAIRTSASSPVVALGRSFQGYAAVTGLRGHSAQISFTLYGPLSLDAAGHCAQIAAFSGTTPSAPVAARTGSVLVTGDQTATATAWTPGQPGCYAVGATAITTNATPNTSADTQEVSVVTVLPTVISLTVPHAVIGPGPIRVDLVSAHSYGHPISTKVTALGPVRPVNDNCSSIDFSTAVSSVDFAPTSVTGDGVASAVSSAATKPGCYRVDAVSTLADGDLGQTQLATASVSLLLINPVVVASVDQVWTIAPQPINAHVDVLGTYNQPAHVSLQMAFAGSDLQGCAAVDWSTAAPIAAGPAVVTNGDRTQVAVHSAATHSLGCYLPIARLVVDANPSIVVTAPIVDLANAVNAGVDPNAHVRLPSHSSGVTGTLPLWLVESVVIGLELAAVFAAVAMTTTRTSGLRLRTRD